MNEKDFEKLVFGMAHQIRNPCAIILSNAKTLLQSPGLKPEVQHSLQAIINGAKYLQARVDEFVEFSKPLHIKPEKVSLYDVFREVIAIFKEKCELQKIKISCNVDKELELKKADREKIILALLNIVLNSIESIKNEGSISLTAEKSNNGLAVTIQDSGCGIHPRDLQEIFSPFYSTKAGGIGIGLAVSKRIIFAHNGKIEISSQQGVGTKVTIELPL